MSAELDRLRRIVGVLRSQGSPHADPLEKAIAEVEGGQRDIATIDVQVSYRLEKFDGEYEPGKVPVEVIEGSG